MRVYGGVGGCVGVCVEACGLRGRVGGVWGGMCGVFGACLTWGWGPWGRERIARRFIIRIPW